MPANIYDLVPVLMCGMSWILCTLVSPNSWDHSDGLASARKLHVVTCNFFRALWFIQLIIKNSTLLETSSGYSLSPLQSSFHFFVGMVVGSPNCKADFLVG